MSRLTDALNKAVGKMFAVSFMFLLTTLFLVLAGMLWLWLFRALGLVR